VQITRRLRPFHLDAGVVLLDHLHCIWTLPPADDNFSNQRKAIKIHLVQVIPPLERRTRVQYAGGVNGAFGNPRKAEPWTGSAGWEMVPIWDSFAGV
jgi:REP element-mobilizing transposase RayT